MRLRVWQKSIFFLFLDLMAVGRAFAGELLPPNLSLPGIRAKGLGIPPVALTGMAQGETPLQNPSWTGMEMKGAQKSVLRGLYFPSLTLGVNATTRSLGRAYFSGKGSTQASIEDFLKAAQNAQTPFGMFEMFPSVTLWRAQWGLFARIQVEGFVWQPSSDSVSSGIVANDSTLGTEGISGRIFSLSTPGPQMNVHALVERGTSLALSTPYKNSGLYLGLTFRPTWRSEYAGSVELSDPLVSETAKNLQAKFNETRGFPVDLGLNIRFSKIAMKPSLGLKLEDVGDTYYRGVNSSHQTVVQKSNLSAGLAGWLFQEKFLSSQCSVSGHHLNDGRVEVSETVGVGCEVLVKGQSEGDIVTGAPVVLRFGGTKDGFSYGLTWDTSFVIMEMASSVASVEGPAGYTPRKDRRYFIRLSVDASQP